MLRRGALSPAWGALAGVRRTAVVGRRLTTSARVALPLHRAEPGGGADAADSVPYAGRPFEAAIVHHEPVPPTQTQAQMQTAQPVPHAPAGVSEPLPLPRTAPAEEKEEAGQATATIAGTGIRVFRTVEGMHQWRRDRLLAGRTVGIVPTMGALHAGHLDLIRAAARDNDDVVVSIYVNPTQFGVHEDLGSYPRTWDKDGRRLAALQAELATTTSRDSMPGNIPGGVSAVFAPTTSEMYPSGPPSQEVDGDGSFVTITPVGKLLEGASRPTFFRGVATVCMKLFHIVQPERAYFGQKDIQQTVVLRRMVKDFCMPMRIVVCPTVREAPDGLALSSRNVYLGPRRRRVANVLRRALVAAKKQATATAADRGAGAGAGAGTGAGTGTGATHADIVGAALRVADETLAAQRRLAPSKRALFEIDYISLSDAETMEELAPDQRVDAAKGAILSGAVRMLPVEEPQPGEDVGHSNGPLVRLIDNIIIPPKA